MKTKSLWYTASRELEVREIDIPGPGCGQVLVRVETCGVCTWDLFIYQGGFSGYVPFPFYFGHEGIGIVEETGSGVEHLKPGDRIALKESPVIGRLGYGHMAEYALQPEATAVKLPAAADPVRWMIEPAACCVNGVDLVCRGGTLEVFSWHHEEFAFDFGRWHERGITVLNTSPAANPHFGDCFLQARALMETGRLDVGELVTHVSSPEDAPELFSKGVEKRDGYMKGVIRWS